MVGGNGRNQFRQYAGQNVGNLAGYNDVIRNQVNQNAVQNVGNPNGLIGVQGNGNQNQIGNEEQYTELLEPIPESHQVPQNNNDVISEDTSVEQSVETVEQHPANFEETRVLYESLYQNLAIEVEKVNSVNRKLKETNADLTTELARFNNQERCFEISQEKYDKLERCYQQSVYQEQCLSKKINALHLSTELDFSNNSKMANVSKSFLIPNEDLSNDTTPSVAHKFLNEVKKTIVTLQRVVKQRMNIETHNWSSSAHQELHKIVRDETFPIVNQVDARLQNFEIQYLKEAAKFVGDFKSLANEADASLAKHKALELEIKRLLKAVVSQGIMIIVQNASVVDTSNLQTELEHTRNLLSQKLKNENVELEFQVLNYARENAHLKATYKNLFDSISVSRAQTKTIIVSLQNELQSNIYKNAKLRTQLFKKVFNQKNNTKDTSENTKFVKQPIVDNLSKVGKTNALSNPVTSNLVSTPQESKSVNNDKTDSAPIYDTDGSAEVHENCDDNEIFNMFTQEEQYTELLEPIPESHQVLQNDNDVISEDTSVEQGGETVEQHRANFEETLALYESLYQNLAIEVEKVNSVNRKLKETNADMTAELTRYKNQKRCFEISQEKYDKLERCYQQSVYQEQCLSKKINALHLSPGKQIMNLNEQNSKLNKQLSKEKSTVSFLLEEKKKLKSDFKTCEDKLLDKQIQLEKRIKELNNIVLKTGQSIQTIHMLSLKPNSFYHTEQKMALGYQSFLS
nr:hypothetical protein [Tanacetum cinerariifolium]